MKFLLDTDIGSDVDDAYALLLSLASPELDIAAVTLVHADVDMRARIAAKLLTLARRTDIPVYKGLSLPLNDKRPIHWGGHEGEGVDLEGAGAVRVGENAVEAIINLAEKHGKELVICPIGPLTNIAAAIQKAPEIMRGIDRLCIMGSCFHGLGPDVAAREHNIGLDPEAGNIVLKSGIPTTLVGLNVTMQVTLKEETVQRLKGRSPLGDFMVGLAERWFQKLGRRWCHMHDPLAVASLLDPLVIRTKPYHAEVLTDGDDAGKTVFAEEGEPKVDTAVEVDPDLFDRLFLSRIFELTKVC